MVVAATAGDGDFERLGVVSEGATSALQATGAELVDGVSAVDAIERSSGSRAFRPLPEALRSRLEAAAETTLTDIAHARHARVIAIGQPLLSEARPHLEAIGRDENASRHLTDICLFLVRANLQARRPDDAQSQVLECIAQSPDLEQPNARTHPPEVLELVSAARESLGDRSSLVVRGADTVPRGCVIRVNGRVIGATPSAQRALPAGRYPVQVECRPGTPARVHVVLVNGAEPAEIVIDGRFDSTLRVDAASGAIALAYSDAATMTELLPRDLARIAPLVGASHALAVAQEDGAIWLRAFEVDATGARMVGGSRVPDPGDAERGRAALGSLLGIEGSAAAARSDASEMVHIDGLLVPAIASYAIGAGGLITFGVAGGIAAADYSAARAECGDTRTCTPERVSGIDDLSLAADIGLGIGVAGVVVGTILIIVHPPRDLDSSERVSARLDVRGTTLSLAGTF
ncbi:MAG: hypothetical protein M3Y87_01020 [Myxococcota bacterium]|nr:hypothetical protein [Myxococcota bacterium]